MRWAAPLLLILWACGSERPIAPPTSGDGGPSSVQAPRLDAGTGDCRDDYRVTVEYCLGADASEVSQSACWRAAVDHYATCIGERESCVTRCGLDNAAGAATQACIDNTCPPASDAG